MGRSFRFLRTLGSGAFGEVLLAEITTSEDFVQTLAVKWLHARHTDDPDLARRLRDEARLLGLLHHPNVVRVQGLTRIDGRLAVLMEPVDGRDLADVHLPPRAAAEVTAAVADALEAAWDTVPPGRSEPLRVVHRDIKPSNVMVTARGLVKVMDFGVARATFETREAQTRSQQYGTARYMAPERWLEGVAEAPSDVFSLGVTLIELAGGVPVARPRLSREGFDADLDEALARLDPWPELQALARDMVRFDPAGRPSASEVRARALGLDLPPPDLRAWAAGIGRSEGVAGPLTGTVVVEDTNADTFALGDPTTGRTSGVVGVPSTEGTALTALTEAAPTEPVHTHGSSLRRAWGVALGAGLLGLVGVAWWFAAPTPGVVQPIPVAAPVPVAPSDPDPHAPERAVAPAPVDVPAPVPASPPPRPAPVEPPPPDPAPVPEVPRVALTFVVDPGVRATAPGGPLDRPRQVRMVTADTILRVQVEHADRSFACTIPVGSTPATWRVGTEQCAPEG